MAGLMLAAGCLDFDHEFDSAFKTGMKNVHDSMQMVFALELYVAKKGVAPANADELMAFIGEEKIPLTIPAGWQVAAQIRGGQCDFTFHKTGESNRSGSFSTTDLDYGKTLQGYLQMEKFWAAFDAPDEKR